MRILIAADTPTLPVSYANCARWFADAVSERGAEVAFAAFQTAGGPFAYRFNGREYRHYSANPAYRIRRAVEDYDPDLILHIRDPVTMIPRLYPAHYSLKGLSMGKPVWNWIPVQHEVLPWDYVDALHRESDLILPFTAAGVELLGNSGVVRDRMEHLPLGISPSYSDPEGPAAFGYGREGVPMFMSVGLGGADRKAFPVLIRACRIAIDRDPSFDAEYYLHTQMIGAYDIPEHAAMMGVDGRWTTPRDYDPSIGFPEEDMARRYRRAFAYVSVGTGEGADMPLMEAMALGRVVIYPREPNREEAVADYGGGKCRFETFPLPRSHNWERLPDPETLADCLLFARKMRVSPEAGREYAERHTWAKTADRFLEIAHARGFE